MSSPLVERLEEVAGPALRAVARYDRDGIEITYERPDVAEKETVIERIHDELVLQELGREYLEHLFQVGRWHCTMHRFERAVCIHYARGEFSGAFVSIDSGADVDLDRIADACHQHAD
ncbi:hypothetical protein [Haloplanus halophilus]|uniref:hypothetical protein n=1 Tax=Haloplanus halophilus TaxID=2949993 RepID=UPI00204042D9|nr:hypothetical protein [Haloplanus sp. GDY1]